MPASSDEATADFPELLRQLTALPASAGESGPWFSLWSALARLPSLAAEAAVREWDAEFLACVLAAVAASKGDPIVAEAAPELVPDVARDFMDWFADR